MKKKNACLAALAVVLVLTASIGSAMAYFTAYTTAAGGYTINLGSKTTIEETFSDWTKHVVISNAEKSEPVFVRARAFGGSAFTITGSGSGWRDGGDGFWYYEEPLAGGSSTAELTFSIEGVPENALVGDSFNIVVVYESTPALYHEDGSVYADWTMILDAEGGEA